MCLPASERMIDACLWELPAPVTLRRKGNNMSRTASGTIPDIRLSRRFAVVQLAGAGAAAIFAASHLEHSRAAGPGTMQHVQSFSAAIQEGTPMTDTTALTVVLVHGAFADSSSWNGVVPDLLSQGYQVVAAANPLRGVTSDADYLASVLSGIEGPIVLVGHSYGGIVISNAASGNDNVKALVYVAAFAPEAGESAIDLSGLYPGSTLGPALVPLPLPGGENDLSIKKDVFWTQFAADVPEATAALMAATQRPITDAALGEAAGDPAWKSIPTWFVYGELDKNIPAAVEVFMAERAGAKEAFEVAGASHVVMISQPQAVTDVIMAAIEAVSPVGAGA
jgi:pimeloyl-ACP methyl ester carboxylesterase